VSGPPAATLKIHETTRPDGTLSPTFLRAGTGALAIVSDEGELELPDGAIEAVMARFGRPLDLSERLVRVGALDLGGGRSLRHVRHRAIYDVIARDYLVYEAPGNEPICALATTVAGALADLGRANALG